MSDEEQAEEFRRLFGFAPFAEQGKPVDIVDRERVAELAAWAREQYDSTRSGGGDPRNHWQTYTGEGMEIGVMVALEYLGLVEPLPGVSYSSEPPIWQISNRRATEQNQRRFERKQVPASPLVGEQGERA